MALLDKSMMLSLTKDKFLVLVWISNYVTFIVNISISVGKLLETEIDSQLVVRPENQVFQIKSNLGVNSTGSSNAQHFFKPYLSVPEKSDIKMHATTSTDATSVSGGFDLILVDN